jgi:predicted CopG family antitoxin
MSNKNRPIGVSPENYVVLHEMRKELPGKKFESFNDVITRLLPKKVKPDAES